MNHPEKELRLTKPMAAAIMAIFREPSLREAGMKEAEARRHRTTAFALRRLVELDLAWSPSPGVFRLTDEAGRMAERQQKRQIDYMQDAGAALESGLKKPSFRLATETHAGKVVRFAPDPLETESIPPRGTLGIIAGTAVFPSGRECIYVDWEPTRVGKRLYRMRTFHHWQDLRLVGRR